MNTNKYKRFLIHRWDTGSGEFWEKVHHSCFRGTKDKDLKRFYKDNDIISWTYSRGGNYEEWEKVKRTDKKVKHRHR